MGILFKDTIILKEACNIKSDIEELSKLQGKVVEEEKLQAQIKLLNAGLFGENKIEFELKNARIGMYVLRDINICVDDLNAQIDYIVITPVHAYTIECKNLVGDITVDSNGQFIRKLPDGKNESIYSPITQAMRHVDIIKKYRDSGRTKLLNALKYLLDAKDGYYKPLVVVANTNGILNIENANKDVSKMIVKVDNLINYLIKDIENSSPMNRCTKDEMIRVGEFFLSANTNREKMNWSNKFTLKSNSSFFNNNKVISSNNLENELKKYRISKSKEKNRPPYYIFTNNEFDKLVSIKPKTINELNGILEPVKIRLYGKDIVKIIEKYIKN